MDGELAARVKNSIQLNLKDDNLATLAKDDSPIIEPIDGGYLNHVCKVKSSSGSESCIVKLYLDHVKVLGPEVAIETDRCQREFDASDYFRSLVPNCSPQPYYCDSTNNISGNKPRDEAVRAKMDELIRDEVVTKATELVKEWMSAESGDCCIHGDLHAGSLMFDGAGGDIKVIDVECARIGPPAFDVALLICNYVLLYHYHQELSHEEAGPGRPDHAQLMADTLDVICITLSRYMEGMSRALKDKFDKHQVWRQILLLLGVEIIAWISGPPSFDCLDNHPKAQLNCLNTALRILHKQSLSLDTKGLSRLIHNQH